MIEKVNPNHPDKVADRIAGAIVDEAYRLQEDPKIAVEVLIGHGKCTIICESSVRIAKKAVRAIVSRIAGEKIKLCYTEVPQDVHLADNQSEQLKCGDNGIFKGVPVNGEEMALSLIAHALYKEYPTDGKFIFDAKAGTFIACQSKAKAADVEQFIRSLGRGATRIVKVNPLGDWTGGTDVDTGATNRKLGSDMGRAVTGGGLHGKDLSKADVAVNIVCYMLAQEHHTEVTARCAIGDVSVAFDIGSYNTVHYSYSDIVKRAREYINYVGGFEKLAEWGLF